MSKRFKILLISAVILFLIVFISFAIYDRNKYKEFYNEGVYLLQEAIDSFRNIPNYTNYKDISELFNKY